MYQLLASLYIAMNALPVNAPMGKFLILFQMFKQQDNDICGVFF